jgi:O-antigen/teichoic acid export membrane protein
MLGAFLIQRGNTLICSAKLGLDDTARYGLSLNLVSIILQISAIPLTIALPEIARLRVARNFGTIWNIFRMRVYLGLTFAAVMILGLSVFAPILMDILQSRTPLLPTPLILLMGGVLLLEYHHSHYGNLVLTENQNPFIIPALVSGALVIIVSWYAADKWGVLGLIAAQGMIQLAWNNWWTVLRGLRGLKSELRS